LPPCARPPGPQLSRRADLEPAWRLTRLRVKQDPDRSCSPLEMLGYDQPGDSHVHGVALDCVPWMPTLFAPAAHLRSSPQIVRTWVQNNHLRHKMLRANHAANQGNSRFTAPLQGPFNP
jgi:hypothetical protein